MKGFNKKLLKCEQLFHADKADDFQQGYAVAGSCIKDYPFCDEKDRKVIRDFFAMSTDDSNAFHRGIMSAARDAKADRTETVNNVAPNGVKGRGRYMPIFTQKEKRAHYTAVANGEKPVKADSKFTPAEQRAYARGQRDALNESARITAFKNSTEAEREAYKEKKRKEREAWKAQNESKQSKRNK